MLFCLYVCFYLILFLSYSLQYFHSNMKWALFRPKVYRYIAVIDGPPPSSLSLVYLWKPSSQLCATLARFLIPQKHSSGSEMEHSALTFQCLYSKEDNIYPKAALHGLIRWVHEKLYFASKYHFQGPPSFNLYSFTWKVISLGYTCHSPFVPPPALLYKRHCIGWEQSQLSQKTVSRGKLLSFLINVIYVALKTSSKNESKLLSPLFISSCVILIQRIDCFQATYKASSSNCSKILKLMEISFNVCHMHLIPELIFKAIVNACLFL